MTSSNIISLWRVSSIVFAMPFSYFINIFLNIFDGNFFVVCRRFLKWIPLNASITQIQELLHNYPKFAKAVGSAARLESFNALTGFFLTILPSGKYKLIYFLASAIGVDSISRVEGLNSRALYMLRPNAGQRRLLGFKPTVRGVAKNPVDHPHGGRTKTIKFPRTP